MLYNQRELEDRYKEARVAMAGRELNEQVESMKDLIKRAIVEGAQLACQELRLDPSGDEAKSLVREQTVGYLLDDDKRRFIAQNKSNLRVISEDVKNTIIQNRAVDTSVAFDFRNDVGEIVNRLKNNVVRIVFTKKDGSSRVMYATLVPELLSLYNAHGRKYGNQGSTSLTEIDRMNSSIPDFVRVLDLEKEEFRSFKPSRLLDYDDENNVPSWIECHPDNDAWYNVVKQEEDIRRYVDANGMFIQSENNLDRERREQGYIHEAQESGVLVDEDTAKAIQYIESSMDKTLKGYIYTLTSLEIPDEVQEYINRNLFYQHLGDLITSLQGIATEEIEGDYAINKRPAKLSISGGAYAITVGTDKFYCHPYFIFNHRTGKVYLDRMGWVSGSEASNNLPRNVKRVDRVFGEGINQFIESKNLKELPLPQRKRVRKTDRTYERRLARMQQFAKDKDGMYKPVKERYNIKVKEIPSNATVQIKLERENITFEVSPTGIIAMDLVNKKPIKLVTVKRGTSTLSELKAGLRAYQAKYRNTEFEGAVNQGVRVVEEVFLDNLFNLRRTKLFTEILGTE